MAPVTRSSQHGRRLQPVQTLPPMDLDGDDDDDREPSSAEEGEPQGLGSSPFRSARDMLLPLQETANRVSRQVEEFAKALDQFKTQRNSSDQELWIEAFGLLRKYAAATESRKRQTASKSRPGADDVQHQLDNLQLEVHLWTLTETLLKCKCPEAVEAAKEAAQSGLSELHRYSTNWDIWNAFLDADTIAQEYEGVLDWLQESAAQRRDPLEQVVADVTQKSDRGDGIWSAGLIYTKDAIKKQKRSRAWPMPLDPSNPGLSKTHVRDEGDALVTQMDPDAPTRESANFIQADEFHEDAAWELCWEMLRRGMRVDEIRAWWSDRNESWRTALLEGSNIDNSNSADSPWSRLMNIASSPEWHARCQQLSEKKLDRSLHETAIYGVLAGNHEASLQACENIEDIFFSYYNAILIQRFKGYLMAFRRKLQDNNAVQYRPAGSTFSVLHDFLASADSNEFLKEELQNPLHFIESALMCQNFDKFFVDQGRAAAQVAHLTGNSAELMEPDQTSPHIEFVQFAAQDQNSVRMIAHLQLLLQNLGFLKQASQLHSYQLDNNIVNYIGCLEREAKFSLLPLYAAKLTPMRATHVLGTVLIKVTDAREQEQTVSLMKRYGLNVSDILFGIFKLANYRELQQLKDIVEVKSMPRITEYTTTSSVKQIKIRTSFMGDDVLAESSEEKAIRSVQWMKYMDASNWSMATLAVTSVYKIFLLGGKLFAAKKLMEHLRLASTSLAAVGMNLNLALITEDGSVNGDADVDMDGSLSSLEHSVQIISPRKRKESRGGGGNMLLKEESSREELAAQSRVWAQLEQLVEAMVVLESWQELANEIEGTRGDPRQMRHFKRALQEALTQVQNAMVPLFEIDFFMAPADDDEKVHLMLIRNHYLPEIVLGYNSVLYFAGHFLSRTYLTQCMTLAQEVAQNEILVDAFVESGRMRELVNAFALDSQALLRANEVGSKSSSSKKGKRESISLEGKSDIWQITWRDEGDINGQAAA